MKHRLVLSATVLSLLGLAGCITPPQRPATGHITPSIPTEGTPPALLETPLLPPPPQATRKKAEVFSVSVHNVPIRDLLFAIARDARLNLDVHPDLQGTVSINAIDQTIQALLDRAAMQVDMRYEMQGRNLFVMPDAPMLRHYQVDYPNVAREARSTVSASSSIGGGGSTGNTGNSSSSSLSNASNNRFWDTLTQNIKDLLRETDKLVPETGSAQQEQTQLAAVVNGVRQGSANINTQVSLNPNGVGTQNNIQTASANSNASATGRSNASERTSLRFREAASVIANPETGVISVRATYRQHLRVREFMDRIISGARRQVMIEATIVEVNLSDQYQQGINWTVFRRGLPLLQFGPAGQALPGGTPVSGIIPSMASITPTYSRPNSITQISAALSLLESFGNTKVLSSPKVSALNNQAALLKVTEDLVYFTIRSTFTPGQQGSAPFFSVTSEPNTVSVGFVMSVMPQISDDDQITLILRPTLSHLKGYVEDPAVPIALAQARAGGVSNLPEISSKIPQIQTRELESIIKVRSGDTAVLGGLMKEEFSNSTDQTPGLGSLPVVGDLFKYKKRENSKSELVIFLRPVVVTDASLAGDHKAYERQLGDALMELPSTPGRWTPEMLEVPRPR